MAALKIAIIGAGPAGLTLARLLQQNGIDCTIYEAEKHRGARNQGGTLDLHPEAGQRALREAGLIDEFKRLSRPEGEADKVIRYDGHVYWDENLITEPLRSAEDDGKPEIDREQLLNLLLDSVEAERVQWNHKVASVECDSNSDGKTTIHFVNGDNETGIDLLVGADGAWSKVRPLVTSVKPFYSGITAIELWSLNVSRSNPWLSQFVGRGSCFMFDEGRAIMAQRMGNDSIRVYACVRQPETWKDDCGIDWSDEETARYAMVQRYFFDCSADLQRLITHTRDALVVRSLFMLPVGITWDTVPGVAILGDAAHLMTPFAGVGVNVALTDALVLAQALIKRKNSLLADDPSNASGVTAAIKEYEEFMFSYAKKNAQKTAHGLESHFRSNGGQERAQRFRGYYTKITGKELSEDHFDAISRSRDESVAARV